MGCCNQLFIFYDLFLEVHLCFRGFSKYGHRGYSPRILGFLLKNRLHLFLF